MLRTNPPNQQIINWSEQAQKRETSLASFSPLLPASKEVSALMNHWFLSSVAEVKSSHFGFLCLLSSGRFIVTPKSCLSGRKWNRDPSDEFLIANMSRLRNDACTSKRCSLLRLRWFHHTISPIFFCVFFALSFTLCHKETFSFLSSNLTFKGLYFTIWLHRQLASLFHHIRHLATPSSLIETYTKPRCR